MMADGTDGPELLKCDYELLAPSHYYISYADAQEGAETVTQACGFTWELLIRGEPRTAFAILDSVSGQAADAAWNFEELQC